MSVHTATNVPFKVFTFTSIPPPSVSSLRGPIDNPIERQRRGSGSKDQTMKRRTHICKRVFAATSRHELRYARSGPVLGGEPRGRGRVAALLQGRKKSHVTKCQPNRTAGESWDV